MDWYKESNDSVIKSLDTDENNGLSDSKVASLLEKYGKNVLKEKKKKSMAAKLKDQFLDPMIIILLLASILSMAIGEVLKPRSSETARLWKWIHKIWFQEISLNWKREILFLRI